MYYLKDPSTKEPSPTLTLCFIGVNAALAKLFLAGFTCCGLKFSEFTGADFALVVSPFLALLAHKRQVRAKLQKDQASNSRETFANDKQG